MARILVVDDEEGIHSFVAECLEMQGHAVAQAESGEQALARSRAGSFELVIPVRLPSLHERPGDIVPLAEALLARIARELKRPGLVLDETARAELLAAPWPGNIRELANVLERAAIIADTPVITAGHLLLGPVGAPAPAPARRAAGAGDRAPVAEALTLEDMERRAIQQALAAVAGNRRKAAARLGIGVRTLYDKLKRYDLE
jgi:two-component system response regulator AtoC